MLKGIKVRLDPTPAQAGLLASHAGGARACFNFLLACINRQRSLRRVDPGATMVGWSQYDLRKYWNEWKDEIAPWWAANSKEAYSYACECLAAALKNWRASRDGGRKGKRVGWPRFKIRKSGMKFAYTTGSFGVADAHGVKLPRIGRVHVMENIAKRVGDGKVKRITVSYEKQAWWASLLVELPDAPKRKHFARQAVGIDLGVKHMATLSDGTVIDNTAQDPVLERHIRRTQRAMARSVKGSNRARKKALKYGKLCARKARKTRDLLDKTTTWLANTYQCIGIEDLNVSGMTRKPKAKPDPERDNHWLPNGARRKAGLTKRILANNFATFRRTLAYKCEQTGSTLIVNDRYYPSSKTCANCGTVKTKLPLKMRTYACEECGFVCDRDLNAAINLTPVAVSATRDVKRARTAHQTRITRARLATPEAQGRNANQAANTTGVRLGADHSNMVMSTKTN